MAKKKKFDPTDPFPPYPQPEAAELKRSPYDFDLEKEFNQFAYDEGLSSSSEAYDNAWAGYANAYESICAFVEGE